MCDRDEAYTMKGESSNPQNDTSVDKENAIPSFLNDKQYLLYSEAASCYALNRSKSESNILSSEHYQKHARYKDLLLAPTSISCIKGLVFSPYHEVSRSSTLATSAAHARRTRSNDEFPRTAAGGVDAGGVRDAKCQRAQLRTRLATWAARGESRAAWTCLIRVSLCQILLGINFLLPSVLYMEYAATFSAPQSTIGWVPSLQKTAALLVALFLSAPLEMYGCRPIAVLSACLLFLGNGLAALAPGVTVLYVTQGLLAGVGTGALEMVSGVLIQQHFSHNRAMAAGLSTVGLSVGNVLGPVLCRHLTGEFGWRGGLLIISAIMAHALPLAFLYRPPAPTKAELIGKENSLVVNSAAATTPRPRCSRACHRVLDCSLLRHVLFGCFCVSSFCRMFCQVAYIFLLPSRAVHGGMSKDEASLLVAILASGNFVARLALSVLANLRGVDRLLLYGAGSIVSGVSAALTPLCHHFPAIAVMAALQGVSLGMTNTIAAVVMVDCVGVGVLPRAYGLYGAFSGVAALTSTPFAGWLYDISGTYDSPFVILGIVALLGGAIVYLTWFWNRYVTKLAPPEGTTITEKEIILEEEL